MQYIAYAQRGELEKCAEESLSLIHICGSGKIPVYYFTELLAEALGVKEEALK